MFSIPTLLSGRTIVIMGIANEWSLAWGIAQACHVAGATLILTYANASVEKRLRPLAEKLGNAQVLPCDVTDDAAIEALAQSLKGTQIHGLVHAIAFADKEELKGGLSQTSRAGFHLAMDVSCYSLIGLTRALRPLMTDDASILTLTYLGSTKVVNNYNVMGLAKAALESAVKYLAAEFGPQGVRVNAISAGPVNTLAARGIGDFPEMLKHHAATSPLRRPTTPEEVGLSSLYFLSPLSQGTTGEVHYVDGGANLLGPTPPGLGS